MAAHLAGLDLAARAPLSQPPSPSPLYLATPALATAGPMPTSARPHCLPHGPTLAIARPHAAALAAMRPLSPPPSFPITAAVDCM